MANIGKWIGYTGKFLYNATPAKFTADGADVFVDGDNCYVVVKDVPMESNVNVTRMGNGKRTVRLNTNCIISHVEWLDNGKEAECDGNSIVVAPFDYGTSLGCRVAKVVFVK